MFPKLSEFQSLLDRGDKRYHKCTLAAMQFNAAVPHLRYAVRILMGVTGCADKDLVIFRILFRQPPVSTPYLPFIVFILNSTLNDMQLKQRC